MKTSKKDTTTTLTELESAFTKKDIANLARQGKLDKFFYRREEAAFVLGIGVRLLDEMIAAKHLVTRRIGRCVVIHAGDLKKLEQMILNDQLLHPSVPKSA